jgi:hypothetical protein
MQDTRMYQRSTHFGSQPKFPSSKHGISSRNSSLTVEKLPPHQDALRQRVAVAGAAAGRRKPRWVLVLSHGLRCRAHAKQERGGHPAGEVMSQRKGRDSKRSWHGSLMKSLKLDLHGLPWLCTHVAIFMVEDSGNSRYPAKAAQVKACGGF